MNLDKAYEYSRTRARSPRSAARLFNDIQQELEYGLYDEEQEQQGQEALEYLAERYPDVEAAANELTDPPALSRSAGQNLDAGDLGGVRRDAGPVEDSVPLPAAVVLHRRRIGPYLALVACVGGFFAVNALGPSSNGCPSGTSYDPTALSVTCDRPDGGTACVEWAYGFTPVPREASDLLQYVPSVPAVGRWCREATSPPG